MPPLKLNLGCGADARPGYVNLDVRSLPGVDVIHNFLHLPWPFPDEHFDAVLAHDVFEHVPPHYSYFDHDHVDLRPYQGSLAWQRISESSILVLYQRDPLLVVLEECWRVLASGGTLDVTWPVPTGNNQFADPTHYRGLSPDAFAVFDPGKSSSKVSTKAKFVVEGARVEDLNYRMRLVRQ